MVFPGRKYRIDTITSDVFRYLCHYKFALDLVTYWGGSSTAAPRSQMADTPVMTETYRCPKLPTFFPYSSAPHQIFCKGKGERG